MRRQPSVTFQPSLFDEPGVSFDAAFTGLERIQLDDACWVDHLPGFVRGADQLFEQIMKTRKWAQRKRWMYEKEVLEPRLTAPWNIRNGERLEPKVLEDMRVAIGARYGVEFDTVGFNLYRDGQDSVAWHSDHILKEIEKPTIALVSVGEPRKFMIRPKGGGASRTFMLGRGELLVTGGWFNRAFEHSVPKVKQAGPRISLAFRHGMDPRAYAHKKTVEPQRTTGQNY